MAYAKCILKSPLTSGFLQNTFRAAAASQLLQNQVVFGTSQCQQVRCLNLQEYQSKQLMTDHGIAVQRFKVAQTVQQAEEISKTLDVKEFVIKAQVLAGGRGKGTFSSGMKGGVKLTKDPAEVTKYAAQMLGYKLKTKQTTGDGVTVNTVMIAEALDIERETYLAILLDRNTDGPVIVASPQGGMDIEEVAKSSPHLIFKEVIDVQRGLTKEQADRLSSNLQFKGDLASEASEQIQRLYKLFMEIDAIQVEINPLGETTDGRVVCFDAKFNFDDSASFRQREIFSQEDVSESDPREVDAKQHGLKYIGLSGNIGCLVNGAGLAMATMDIIKLHGGEPANFLDVGGSVNEDQVYHAFKLLSSDANVKTVLVNIFGGIVNCRTIAAGIKSASENLNLDIPLVVRLEGTNVEEAREVLKGTNLNIIQASSLQDAADKAVSVISS